MVQMEAAVAALRVARFLEAEAYLQAAERWVAREVAAPCASQADVLAALAAATELKQRSLVARCLAAAAARFEGAALGAAADLLQDLALAQAALATLGCAASPAATPRHPAPSKLPAAQANDDSPMGRHGPALAAIAVGPRTPSPGPEEELARRLEAALEHRAWGA